MTDSPSPKPTDAELAILRIIWERGPSTVREVHSVMEETRKAGYTTVLKFLQIMTDKKLVTRNESQRAHVYEAAYTQEQTQKQLVGDLLERAFGGSAMNLVVQALNAKRASQEELAEIRKIIEERESHQ